MRKWISPPKKLIWIVVIGLFLRILFLVWGAEYYFDRPNIHLDGDSYSYIRHFENLINTGEYTIEPGNEMGYFSRLPGYSFFIGAFYLLSGKDWLTAIPLIAWVQVLLDFIGIFLIYHITLGVLKNKQTALISALLFAVYPFVIVWNPVIYAESLSIFLLLFGTYFFFSAKGNIYLLFGSLLWGFGILVRPQLAFLFPAIGFYLLIIEKNWRLSIQKGLIIFLGLLFSYGLWPARNWINHNQLVFTTKLENMSFYAQDVTSFRSYVYSVKPEWEPQFSQIVKGEIVDWPARSYHTKEDSLLLESAVMLSRDCGKGFNNWKRTPVKEDCNNEIVSIFEQLRKNQIRAFPFNFFIWVPLQNLGKTIFKSNLNNEPESGLAKHLTRILFLYRTLLIISGLAGLGVLIKKKHQFGWFIMVFWFLVYFYIAFVNRNVEMRYLLHADILLLIPASYCFYKIFDELRRKFHSLRTI